MDRSPLHRGHVTYAARIKGKSFINILQRQQKNTNKQVIPMAAALRAHDRRFNSETLSLPTLLLQLPPHCLVTFIIPGQLPTVRLLENGHTLQHPQSFKSRLL